MYKSLLPQSCVNKVFYYPYTCTSPYCHSAVSIRVPTNPLHVQVLTTTVLCQKGFLPPLYMYKSLLPQCCVNKFFYRPSTFTSLYCHNAVSIRFFTTPLHAQVLIVTVLCQSGFLPPHVQVLAATVMFNNDFTTPPHVQVLTATVLWQ